MRKLFLLSLFLFCIEFCSAQSKIKFAVVVSANIEWRATKLVFPNEIFSTSPWGEYFFKEFEKEKLGISLNRQYYNAMPYQI